MINHQEDESVKEARSVFLDIRDFFESENKTTYLATVISEKNVRKVLDEIERIFIEIEDYERCSQIVEWRKKLDKLQIR